MAANGSIIGELNKTEKGCEWKIPNFSSLCQIDNYYNSSSFTFMNKQFYLRIFPIRNTFDCLSLFLMSRKVYSLDLTYSFSIKKSDGTLMGTKIATTSSVIPSDGFLSFTKTSALMEKKSELLPDDTLTVICELFPEEQTLISVKEANILKKAAIEASKQKRLTNLITLSEDLKNLFLKKESCDTTLHVVDREYKAHKALLIARSSVFAAMFQHETTEKRTGIVNIPDCDPESFEQFLLFLYSGNFEITSPSVVVHLYQTSEKYNVQKLKTVCSEFLMENLTVEDFCDVVIMADKYDDTKLFTAAQSFFNKNLSSFFPTTEWKDLMINHYRLANKLLMEMASKVKVLE